MAKKVNELNSLSDMTTFPWCVHLGASLNIVFSIWCTSLVFQKTGGNFQYFLPFAVALVALNVLSVIILRIREIPGTPYPEVNEMGFFGNQHRFSTWVYGIASGNMFFWLAFAWWAFSLNYPFTCTLIVAQVFSFLVTYVPLWRKFLK